MTSPSRRQLLVFGRAPRAGRVKTRLIPHLGAEGAAGVYRRLLEHALAVASALPGVRAAFWYQGSEQDRALCAAYARRFGLGLHRQQGDGLGERMLHALGASLDGAGRAVLIGSDSPAYTRHYLEGAFAALDGHDAVLGPAADGGYVLIGLRRPAARLFESMPWGGDRVLELTRQRLSELGWRWAELPVLRDVDRADDLILLEPNEETSP